MPRLIVVPRGVSVRECPGPAGRPGHRVSGGNVYAAVEVALGGADARTPVGRAVGDIFY